MTEEQEEMVWVRMSERLKTQIKTYIAMVVNDNFNFTDEANQMIKELEQNRFAQVAEVEVPERKRRVTCENCRFRFPNHRAGYIECPFSPYSTKYDKGDCTGDIVVMLKQVEQ